MEIDGKKIFHLGIGIPSGDHWLADFAISVLSVIGDLKRTTVPGYDDCMVSVLNVKSSTLSQQREDIVDKAMKDQCDALLWADSDQVFPGYTVRRLLKHGKDIVGCNIALKMIPSLPTARKHSETYPKVGEIVYTRPESTGLEKVWRLGFGIMLINMDVFKRIEKPYFNLGWSKEIGYKGEDWSFCEKAEAAGTDIWVDHDLSKDIYHLGTYRYGHKDIDSTETNIKIKRAGEDEV
jgi:hypothetical protein